MIQYLKENGVMYSAWQKMSEEEKIGKFPIGKLYSKERKEYTDQYQILIDSLGKGRN
jgi:hypothetical protein